MHICWARNNESALVRVPAPKKGKESSTRIEFRSPDPACNPYLAFSVMLAAGLKGVEEGYDLPPEATNNIYEMTPEERAAEGIGSLPQTLAEAIDGHGRIRARGRSAGGARVRVLHPQQAVGVARLQGARHALGAGPVPGIAVMAPEPLLVFPDPPPPLLAQTLDLAGYPWKAVANASVATQSEPADGWAGAVVCADEDPEGAFGICRALRKRDSTLEPVLLLVSGAQLGELEMREDLFDDFCLAPFHQKELEARLRHLFWRTGRGARPEIVEYGDLVLNLETYQAALGGRPLDLTYMEYELLKFFATHSSKVFTREQLLSRVWGYEYYGGARTVDVHVRRLRAKLGEEHASLIQTVRSVGYRFGSPRWAPGGRRVASDALQAGFGPRRASLGVVDEQPAHQRAPDRPAQHHRDRGAGAA